MEKLNGPYQFSDGTKCWYKEGKYHREDGPAVITTGYAKTRIYLSYWYLDGVLFKQETLEELIHNAAFLGKEKGRYNLKWLKFFTEDGIKEFPIIPGMENDKLFCFISHTFKAKYAVDIFQQ